MNGMDQELDEKGNKYSMAQQVGLYRCNNLLVRDASLLTFVNAHLCATNLALNCAQVRVIVEAERV